MKLFFIFFGATGLACVAHCNLKDQEGADTAGLAIYWGYPGESHTVQTKDGYLLTVHRVPHGKGQSPGGNRPVVFMQHGMESSSSCWVTQLPNQSAAFIFADAGYDVWLGNFRGNTYGKRHAWLDVNSLAFWSFSWDEMAEYDLPAMLTYVLNTTGQTSLHFIGHSLGTTVAFAAFSTNPPLTANVTSMHLLGPVAHLGNIGSGMLQLLAPYADEIGWFDASFGQYQFEPSSTVQDWISAYVCGLFWGTNPLCANLLFLIGGPNSHQLNMTRLPVYFAHSPAGSSTMNYVHLEQMVASNKFSKFDWGLLNEQHYHQLTPPLYNLAQVAVPTYLHSGDNDILADPEDVDYLVKTLPTTTLKGHWQYTDFNHLDFIWGERAAAEVYAKILSIMKTK